MEGSDKAVLLRSELKQLYSKKTALEDEIKDIVEQLNTPISPTIEPVGLKGNLVDKEGYPRNDVDVHKIRTLRNKYACLQTDHKTLMNTIENKLKQLMAIPLSQQPTSTGRHPMPPNESDNTEQNKVKETEVEVKQHLVAFLRVDKVDKGSPAEESGLNEGDLVLQFGEVVLQREETGHQALRRVVTEVGNNIESQIEVTIQREMERKTIKLVPKQWDGRGVLGCKLIPL